MEGGPHLTFAQAVEVVSCSASTLRRRRGDLEQHGAKRTHKGEWQIPISALVHLGLMPPVTAPDNPPGKPVEPAMTPTENGGESGFDNPLAGEVERLREALAAAERRAAVAEARAEEREKNLEDLRQSLRLLEPPKPQLAIAAAEPAGQSVPLASITPIAAAPSRRPRWWRRLAG